MSPEKLLAIDIVTAVDGLVITAEPHEIYSNLEMYNGILNVKELIIGFNTLDGVVSFPWHAGARPTTDAEYKAFLNGYIPDPHKAEKIYSVYYLPDSFHEYPPDHNIYELAWFTINADTCLTCPSLFMANQIENVYGDAVDTYIYRFGGPGNHGQYLAPHGSEVPFVLSNEINMAFYDMQWNQTLSNEMTSAWTNFVKHGDPNITDYVDGIDFDWPSKIMPQM